MKIVMQRYLALGLAVWVLCTSTGFSLYAHVCHFTGKVQLSAEKPEACCPAPRSATSDPSFTRAACCDTQLTVVQLQTVSFPVFEKVQVPCPLVWDDFRAGLTFHQLHTRSAARFVPARLSMDPPLLSSLPLFLRVANLRL